MAVSNGCEEGNLKVDHTHGVLTYIKKAACIAAFFIGS